MKGLQIAMIVLWSTVALAIVAIIIYSIAFQDTGFGFHIGLPDSKDMTLAVDETIPADNLDKISVDLSSDECVIYLTDSDSVNVKHYVYNVPENRYARVSSSGNGLNISTKNTGPTGLVFFGFGINRRSLLEVYIPESYKNRLDVDLSSGDVDFNSAMKLSDLNVKVSSGVLTFNYAMETGGLNIQVSSGDMRAKELIKTENASMTVTSGKIRLTGGLETDEYTIKVSSGDMNIDERLTGSGNVTVTSGTVRLSGVDISDSLEVGASSGDINVQLAGNPSLDFTARKSSGTIRTYFDALHDDRGNYSATVGDGPYKKLDAKVTSGTVRITQAE